MSHVPRVVGQSIRPEQTTAPVARTGLAEDLLRRHVDRVYAATRVDQVSGPVFDARIPGGGAYPTRKYAFRPPLPMMTGRDRGAPMSAHMELPAGRPHFERWIALCRDTGEENRSLLGAVLVVEKAKHKERSLHDVIAGSQASRPVLR